MVINLLLRLLIAHLLTDFVLQPQSWIRDRREKKLRSMKLIWHAVLSALVAYILSGRYGCWLLPLAILVSHYLIDLAKSYLPETLLTFLGDQLLHLLVIVAIWLSVGQQWHAAAAEATKANLNDKFWLLALGYLFVSWPLGIFVGTATARWRQRLSSKATVVDHLADAGKWIGICERVLILTFVLTRQYTAIGFLITAKSILRFGEKDEEAEKKTEYILVGTLLSFATSALFGVLLSMALK